MLQLLGTIGCGWRRVSCAARVATRWLLVALLGFVPVCAQQLSVRRYDVSDGLAHSHVGTIYQDRKGYLWFGTWEGLSRFDGYHFTNYGERDSLGHVIVNAIAEDQRGRLWVGTNGGGVSRLVDDPRELASPPKKQPTVKQKFITYRVGDSLESNRVNALLFDAENRLWCATDDGLYRALVSADNDLRFEVVLPHQPTSVQMAAFGDSRGRLWFGMQNALIEIVRGQVINYGSEDEVGRHFIQDIVEDSSGKLLVANERGVYEFITPDGPESRGRWQRFPVTLAPDQIIYSMTFDSAGTLWIGTSNGLIKYRAGQQTVYATTQGLGGNVILALAEDRDGNLWIGTSEGGISKLASELIVSFTKAEGLTNQSVIRVIEDRQGRIYASIPGGLVEIKDQQAVPVSDAQVRPFNSVIAFQDSRGNWWCSTERGLYWFQGPELQLRRGKKITSANGLPAEKVNSGLVGIIEDPFGRLWLSYSTSDLYRLDLARPEPVIFERVSLQADPPLAAVYLMGDRAGTIWFGQQGGLGRLIEGRVVPIEPSEGLPEANPRCFFQDSRGWVWIGLRYKGVSVTKDPTAETLKFSNYSTNNGLASDAVWSITEDDAGRIYLGTGKGLDQLDPATGRIRHFDTQDGLAGDLIVHCHKDRDGNIWVATSKGLSKFNPRAERIVDRPPPIYLSRVSIAGEDVPLPETGTLRVADLALPAARNNLVIEYVALSFQGEQKLRYQYKLEGVDADWSLPTEARAVNYARLAPGTYQFLVRAINQEGAISPEPATLQFRILPPVWQRWWFVTLALATLGSLAYALHRYRVARLVELERVRTRIAADLHDDIGSGLSRIAILSEVARQQAGRDYSPVMEPLSSIATASRDLVDSMGDIVWAVNPQHDQIRDLAQRMRRFASDLFTARNIEFHFHAPSEEQYLKIGADVRRQVYLIFKEAVNNVVRHSGCTLAEIELRVESGRLVLTVRDDGRGFEASRAGDGNGLVSMRARARSMGGELHVETDDSRGTTVTLRVSLQATVKEHDGRLHGGK